MAMVEGTRQEPMNSPPNLHEGTVRLWQELFRWRIRLAFASPRLCGGVAREDGLEREATMGAAAELEPGEVFAVRYEIQRLLGEGERKRTYLARDTKMDRLVAVSFVKPEGVLSDPEGTEREAKVLGRIGEHDNIVSLYNYEIDRDGSVQYMVFEYLSGGTLAEYLRKAGQRSLDEVLRLGRQLSRGLAHLHKRGLIHRDVSPENVWLDERHVAHLGDFDSAIPAVGAGDLRPITTSSFAAPEEREGGPLDARSDLYSLGGILLVSATGARNPGEIGLRAQRPDLPSAFGDLTAELLSESPDDRPPDAGTVLERLNEIRYGSNVDALIAAGECDTLELKSSLHHPHGPLPADLRYPLEQGKLQPVQVRKEMQKRLNKEVTQTIAAFLNSRGGTLLIGVDDAGATLGIEPDFAYCQKEKQDADGWMLSLKTVIINALGADVWSAIRVSLVPHREKMVAVILCPRRASQTWHYEDGGESFCIRTGNATTELKGRRLVGYITEHWPA
jgi:serine/threonine protein kinase